MSTLVTHTRILSPLIRSYQSRGLDLDSARGLARMDTGLGECECCRRVTGRTTRLETQPTPETPGGES